ncbi:MAG: hypothetical protein NTZ64_15200 [Polaromonas sp.]|nr:hypothetical protein [Polaromonas sp.]
MNPSKAPEPRAAKRSRLVPHWRRLWRAWSVQLAALGVVLPELLQLIADNTSGLDWLGGGTQNAIRLACLVGVLLLRPVKQGVLAEPVPESLK